MLRRNDMSKMVNSLDIPSHLGTFDDETTPATRRPGGTPALNRWLTGIVGPVIQKVPCVLPYSDMW